MLMCLYPNMQPQPKAVCNVQHFLWIPVLVDLETNMVMMFKEIAV